MCLMLRQLQDNCEMWLTPSLDGALGVRLEANQTDGVGVMHDVQTQGSPSQHEGSTLHREECKQKGASKRTTKP